MKQYHILVFTSHLTMEEWGGNGFSDVAKLRELQKEAEVIAQEEGFSPDEINGDTVLLRLDRAYTSRQTAHRWLKKNKWRGMVRQCYGSTDPTALDYCEECYGAIGNG